MRTQHQPNAAMNFHCALTAAACIGIVLCAALLSNAAEFKMQEFKMTEFKMLDPKSEGTKQQASPSKGKTQSVQFVFVVPKQQADQKKKDSQESQKKSQSPASSMPKFALPVLPLPGTKK